MTARGLRTMLLAALACGSSCSSTEPTPAGVVKDKPPPATDAVDAAAPPGTEELPRAPTTSDIAAAFVASPYAPTTKTELVNGVIVLRSDLSAAVTKCDPSPTRGGPTCRDADGDGLVDAWEAFVLDHLRPRIELDEDERIVGDPKGRIGIVGRVAPRATAGTEPFVALAFMILGYSRDYGSCGFTAHNGDNERVVLELSVSGGDATVTRAYTASHEGAPSDDGHVYAAASLVSELRYVVEAPRGEPRWLVLASRDKHATYANQATCTAHSSIRCLAESCSADGVANLDAYRILPPYVNAGEPAKHLADDLTPIGFAGETAWGTSTFCGGLGGSGCAGGNADKLTADPFL